METKNLGSFTNIDASDEPQKWQRILDYASSVAEIIQWRKNAMDNLQLKDGMTVLDVGCGLGNTTRMISELISPHGKVIGIDLSQAQVDVAQQRSKRPNEQYQVGDVTHLEFSDNTFDAIHIERVLHHVKNAEQGFAELYRVLKPGGRLCILEPDFNASSISPLPAAHAHSFSQEIMKSLQNGDIGKRLLQIAKKLNLSEEKFIGCPVVYRDFEFMNDALLLTDLLNKLTTSPQQTDEYLAAMREADKNRTFLLSIPCFQLTAKK